MSIRFSVVALLFPLLFASCDIQTQDRITFLDEDLQEGTIRGFEENGLSFRLDGNTLWYASDDRERVDQIFSQALRTRPYKITVYDKGKAVEFVGRLEESGIEAELISKSDGVYDIKVKKEHAVKARSLMHEVILGERKQ
jgi:hypothetical protein